MLRGGRDPPRSEEHTSELQSRFDLVCRLLLEKKKMKRHTAGATGAAWRTQSGVARCTPHGATHDAPSSRYTPATTRASTPYCSFFFLMKAPPPAPPPFPYPPLLPP